MTREEKNKKKQKKIVAEEKKKRAKKKVKKSIKVIIVILIIIASLFFINKFVATKKIIVKEKRIVNKKIPDNFSGIKIIQFSDLKYGSNIFIKDLSNIVNLINSKKPDIVLFTGDLVDNDYKLSKKDKETLIKNLSKIKSKMGKYAVFGNEDNLDYNIILNQSNFTLLNNSHDLIYKDGQTPILLVGIASLLNNNSDIKKAFSFQDKKLNYYDFYTIVMFHEPDLADEILKNYDVDLLLAGHSHNGYTSIPFINKYIKIDGATKYYKNYYQLNDTDFYISSGLGTDGIGVRFLCHPSINLFRLSSK